MTWAATSQPQDRSPSPSHGEACAATPRTTASSGSASGHGRLDSSHLSCCLQESGEPSLCSTRRCAQIAPHGASVRMRPSTSPTRSAAAHRPDRGRPTVGRTTTTGALSRPRHWYGEGRTTTARRSWSSLVGVAGGEVGFLMKHVLVLRGLDGSLLDRGHPALNGESLSLLPPESAGLATVCSAAPDSLPSARATHNFVESAGGRAPDVDDRCIAARSIILLVRSFRPQHNGQQTADSPRHVAD